jgi:hypothetical protein
MKKILSVIAVLLLASTPALAQVSAPNTFVTGARILASEVNANFDALESGALNRTGGTITGNISVDSGVTIDGIDIGAVLGGSGTPTFSTLTVSGDGTIGGTFDITGDFSVNTNKFNVTASSGDTTVAGTLGITGATTAAAITASGTLTSNGTTDINSTFTVGSGNVQPFTAGGKIQALSTTYLDNLSGTNLTGIGLLASTNTWTGRNDLKGYTELKSTSNPSGSAITYDLSNGTHFETALSGNATVTISNVPAPTNGVVAFTVKFTADGTGRTFTWPGSVVWAHGAAIDFTDTNAKRDFVTFISYDAGTTWFAFIGGQNF